MFQVFGCGTDPFVQALGAKLGRGGRAPSDPGPEDPPKMKAWLPSSADDLGRKLPGPTPLILWWAASMPFNPEKLSVGTCDSQRFKALKNAVWFAPDQGSRRPNCGAPEQRSEGLTKRVLSSLMGPPESCRGTGSAGSGTSFATQHGCSQRLTGLAEGGYSIETRNRASPVVVDRFIYGRNGAWFWKRFTFQDLPVIRPASLPKSTYAPVA